MNSTGRRETKSRHYSIKLGSFHYEIDQFTTICLKKTIQYHCFIHGDKTTKAYRSIVMTLNCFDDQDFETYMRTWVATARSNER